MSRMNQSNSTCGFWKHFQAERELDTRLKGIQRDLERIEATIAGKSSV